MVRLRSKSCQHLYFSLREAVVGRQEALGANLPAGECGVKDQVGRGSRFASKGEGALRAFAEPLFSGKPRAPQDALPALWARGAQTLYHGSKKEVEIPAGIKNECFWVDDSIKMQDERSLRSNQK